MEDGPPSAAQMGAVQPGPTASVAGEGGGYDAPGRSPRVVRLPPLSSTSSSRVVPWGGGGGTSRTATGGPGDQASSTSKAGSPSPSTTSTTMRTLLGFTRTADGYTTQTRLAGPLDVWALGIVIVIGGQCFSWNAGLVVGLGSYLLGLLLIGLAYTVLICSMAEMAGALPFSGGAFGFSRATHGTYVGYLVGCCESAEYILYVSSSVLFLGELITQGFGTPPALEPLWWLAFYCLAVVLNVCSGRWYWRLNLALAVLLVAMVAGYCLVTIPLADMHAHGPLPPPHSSSRWFSGGLPGFLTALPLLTWFFVGVEALPMACDVAIKPRSSVPSGMVWCVATLFCTALAMLLSVVAVGPDPLTVAARLLPLSPGLVSGLRLPPGQAHMADLASLLATATTAYGFIFPYGRQLCAMASSGLLPPVFSVAHPSTGSPMGAIVVGSIAGYVSALLLWLSVRGQASVMVFEVCITFALVTYICQLSSYVKLQSECASLARPYRSPFGVKGAKAGAALFALTLVGSLFFHLSLATGLFVLAYLVATTAHYIARARHTQRFSRDEMASMVTVYAHRAAQRRAEMAQGYEPPSSPRPPALGGTAGATGGGGALTLRGGEGGGGGDSSPRAFAEDVSVPQQGGWSLNDAGIRFVGDMQPVQAVSSSRRVGGEAEAVEDEDDGLVVVDDTSFFSRLMEFCREVYEELMEEEDVEVLGSDGRPMVAGSHEAMLILKKKAEEKKRAAIMKKKQQAEAASQGGGAGGRRKKGGGGSADGEAAGGGVMRRSGLLVSGEGGRPMLSGGDDRLVSGRRSQGGAGALAPSSSPSSSSPRFRIALDQVV